MRICVFAGAAPEAAANALKFGFDTGFALGSAGIGLVYGGGGRGMMGAVADGALAANAEVIGVIPQFLHSFDGAHAGLEDIRIVDDMHSRKKQMYELADGFLALPGAFGTLEEAMEILTWKQLRLHTKPIVFLDDDGRWDPLKLLFDRMEAERFLAPSHRGLINFLSTIDDTVALFLGARQEADRQ